MSGVTAMSQNRSCGSCGPGHLMHWIQGKKSHEDAQPIIKVKVVAVHDDRRAEIESHDLKLTLWYHDLDHLRSALCLGGRAEWRPKYYVLCDLGRLVQPRHAGPGGAVQTAHTSATG